jgi:DNA replication protein DnaC
MVRINHPYLSDSSVKRLWHPQIFGDPIIADAVLDRLVHSAHKLELKGESLRKLRASKNARLDEAITN